jgi:hypothetical protein
MDALGAGLLSAFGNFGLGLGGAMDQQRKDAPDREKLEQDRNPRQQVIDAQASQFAATQAAAERDKYAQMSDLQALAQQIGIPLPDTMGPSGGRFPREWGPEILKEAAARQKVQQEQALRGQQADVLARLGAGTPAGPAQLAGQLAEGEEPEAAALIPRTQTPATPANARYQAIAGLLRQGPLTEYLVKALDEEKQAAVGHAPPGSTIYNPRTGAPITTVPALPKEPKYTTHTVATREGVFEVIRDEQGNEVSRTRAGSPVQEPREPREAPRPTATETILDLTRQRQALQRQGVPDTDPRIMDLNGQLESIGGTRYQPKTVAPTARERTDMADMRTSIGSLDKLMKDVDANKQVLGNIVSNPWGAGRRGLSDYVPSMTTAAEKEFLGSLSTQVNQLKTELIGKQRTVPELKDLVDLLPEKGQVDVSIVPRLRAIRTLLERKLAEREAVFGGAGPAPAGGGGGGWGAATTVP